MNKILLMIFIHILVAGYALASFAKEVRGQVVNTIRDDEGLKVILETQEKKKKKTQVVYLSGENKAFVQNEELLNKAMNEKKPVVLNIKKDVLSTVETVKLEK